ncbi:MAG: hypothetical protein Q9222_002964 [Ikaeria aurantiellina]
MAQPVAGSAAASTANFDILQESNFEAWLLTPSGKYLFNDMVKIADFYRKNSVQKDIRRWDEAEVKICLGRGIDAASPYWIAEPLRIGKKECDKALKETHIKDCRQRYEEKIKQALLDKMDEEEDERFWFGR